MENQQDLQKQIDELKKRLDAFNASPTIPLAVNNAWHSRGFLKETNMVFGSGTLSGSGEYNLVIPGANLNSIVLVTAKDGGGASPLEAEIIPSSTYPNQYEIYVQGTATSPFYFVVFLFSNNWYVRE